MERFYLAIDLGTTGCRSMVFDRQLQLRGSAYREYGLIAPRADWYEQDATLWWELSCETLQQAAADAGIAPAQIQSISISSQGISIVPVDEEGTPLCNALSWMDTRAKAETAQLLKQLGDEATYRLTGKHILPCYTLPKLLWLQKHAQDIWAKTKYLWMPLEYLTAKFTGNACTDASMASGTLLYDMQNGCWHLPTLQRYGIAESMLAQIRPCGSSAGTVLPQVAEKLGLSPDCIVSVGAQDQRCAALGAGLREDTVTVSLGTAAAICKLWSSFQPEQTTVGWSPYIYEGSFVTEGVANTAGAALRWLRDILYPGCDYNVINREAAQAREKGSQVLFHPFLGGSAYPRYDIAGTGCFYGLSMATTRGELALAVMEGVAFEITEILEKVDPENKTRRLMLFGGGAKSALWQQIFADATGKEILMPQLSEAAGVGAAMLAGIGCGDFTPEQLPCMGIGAAARPGQWYEQTQIRLARFRKLEDKLAQGGIR